MATKVVRPGNGTQTAKEAEFNRAVAARAQAEPTDLQNGFAVVAVLVVSLETKGTKFKQVTPSFVSCLLVLNYPKPTKGIPLSKTTL